jgi:tRNA pseudouridine38-40 synthase
MKILLTVAYDGSGYYGWQRQKNFVSVQQRIEEGLSALLKKDITIRGASRTDTGVHSVGQRAVFTDDTITIPVDKIPYALNSFLPDDIVITAAESVDESFHPQYSVTDKTYEYKILNAPFKNPMLNRYTEFIRQELNIEEMQKACVHFLGEHDFKAFCATGGSSKTTVRSIYSLDVFKENDNIITIRINGSGFLYNMVRIVAGTLVYVGLGKLKSEDIPDIIASCDRARAGKTLSPNGLTLMEVNYERK